MFQKTELRINAGFSKTEKAVAALWLSFRPKGEGGPPN